MTEIKTAQLESILKKVFSDGRNYDYKGLPLTRTIIEKVLEEYKSQSQPVDSNWQSILHIMFETHQENLPKVPVDHEQSELYMIMAKRIEKLLSLPISNVEDKIKNVLPCPFCGNYPEWVNLAHPSGIPALRCDECQFAIQQDRRDKTLFYWNRRQSLPINNVDEAAEETANIGTPFSTKHDAYKFMFIEGAKWYASQLNRTNENLKYSEREVKNLLEFVIK